jgi:hypothetical protein
MSKYIDILTGRKFDKLPTVKVYDDGSVKHGGELTIDDFTDEGIRLYEAQKAPEGTVATATRIVDVDGRTAREEVVATITTAEALAAHDRAEAEAQAARDKAIADFDKWEKDSRNWNRRERIILAMAKPKEMSAEEWQARFDEEWSKLNA